MLLKKYGILVSGLLARSSLFLARSFVFIMRQRAGTLKGMGCLSAVGWLVRRSLCSHFFFILAGKEREHAHTRVHTAHMCTPEFPELGAER